MLKVLPGDFVEMGVLPVLARRFFVIGLYDTCSFSGDTEIPIGENHEFTETPLKTFLNCPLESDTGWDIRSLQYTKSMQSLRDFDDLSARTMILKLKLLWHEICHRNIVINKLPLKCSVIVVLHERNFNNSKWGFCEFVVFANGDFCISRKGTSVIQSNNKKSALKIRRKS
jgi:hypothetical protein